MREEINKELEGINNRVRKKVIKSFDSSNTLIYNDEIIKETAKRIIELIESESETSIGNYEGEDWTPDEKLEKQNKQTCTELIKNIKQKFLTEK